MRRGSISPACGFGTVLLIGLALSSGVAANRSEISELAFQARPDPAVLDPEVADRLYQDWSAVQLASASEEYRERAPAGTALDFEEEMLPAPKGVTTTFFKRFTGAFFQPRNPQTASYQYFGTGCITATADSYYVHEVQVPDGAVIDFIRFFYYDAVATDATMFVTTYDAQGGSTDIVNVSSAGSGGYGSRGTPMDLTVDSIEESIMILYRPNTVSASLALCGARIRYQYNPLGVVFRDSFEAVS